LFVDVGDAGVSKVTLLLFIDKSFVSPIACVVVGVTLLMSRCIPGSVFSLFLGSLVALDGMTESDVGRECL
jgi:hypothetical protein